MNILEILVTFVDVIVESFCESYLAIVLFSFINKNDYLFFNRKGFSNFLKFWAINSVAFIANRALHIFLPDLNWLKPILFALITSCSTRLVYGIKFYKGLIVSILILIISAIFEVVLVLVLKCFNVVAEDIVQNIYYYSVYACSLAILKFGIAFVVYKTKTIVYRNIHGEENKLKYFMPQLIAVIVCLFPSMILLILNYYEYSAYFVFINLIQLLVVAFVGIYNLDFVIRHEHTEMELANTIIYNETLKKVNDGVRGFKHDMGNIVQSILGYIAINDSEGAKKYCQNLVIGFNDINVLSILSPKVIDDPAIYGVVVNKILIARDKNMTLSLDVNLNVSEINFPKFELSRILGILIDNAIEAGEQTEEKKLIVNMHHDYTDNTDVIIISNSIENLSLDVNKIFEKDYSTKANPSGFGLYEVKKFINKNPQATISTSIDKKDKLFTQILTIHCDY